MKVGYRYFKRRNLEDTNTIFLQTSRTLESSQAFVILSDLELCQEKTIPQELFLWL